MHPQSSGATRFAEMPVIDNMKPTMIAIDTSRLVLRHFRKEDAADLYDYLHQPTASCFLSLAPKDMEEARREAEQRSASDEHIAVCLNLRLCRGHEPALPTAV